MIQFKNEHFLSGKKIITDSHLYVGELSLRDHHYHFECESKSDGTIALRMMQYDFVIALEEIEKTAADEYRLRLPRSAVLYLRHNNATPDHIIVKLQNENDESLDHEIKVIKIGKYTVKRIFEKKLIVLYPFYIMNYEAEINSENWNEIKQEEMFRKYEIMNTMLQENAEEWPDSDYVIKTLLQTAKTIAGHIFRKRQDTKERMEKIMGGNVIDDPFIKLKIEYNHLTARNKEIESKYEDIKTENEDIKAENKEIKQENLHLISLLKEHGINYNG